MSKKLTIERIREEFSNYGFILTSTEYKGNKSKLDYICPKGHKHSISWNNWTKGARCPYCVGLAKSTIKQVREDFEKEGYTLLDTVYKNSHTKLHYICPVGHKHSITYDSWKHRGNRCFYCGIETMRISRLKDFSIIQKSFEWAGYILLTKNYRGSKVRLDYICPVGHKNSMSWNNWDKGHRCPTCKYIGFSGLGHPNWKGGISCEPYCQDWTKEFKEFIKERDGYRCLNPYCDSKNPNDLVIHHIDYNKKNCGPDNLITVCRSCNNRANKDREWHKFWYKAIIQNRYSEYNKNNT